MQANRCGGVWQGRRRARYGQPCAAAVRWDCRLREILPVEIHLPPEMETFIKGLVERGYFVSPDDEVAALDQSLDERLHLRRQMKTFIKGLVERGYFVSPDDVIQNALYLLKDQADLAD